MTVGTFVYVMTDGLVTKTLSEQQFTYYPSSLRENRQSLKSCIVPLVIALSQRQTRGLELAA
jgi:hypothetical protein